MNGKKTKILFICVENSCRSQMAEGFAKKFGGGKVEAFSAGSRPSGHVNSDAIAVMKEVGLDISEQRSKGFSDLPYKEFDIIVTMGCGDACPFFPAKERFDWQIEDPKGKDRGFFRRVRDAIKIKVNELFESIKW